MKRTIEKIARDLKQPFLQEDLEFRPQKVGYKNGGRPYVMLLVYVTNRAIQKRLDETVGIMNWKNVFSTLVNSSSNNGAMCGISIRLNDSEWVTKWDGSENTGIESIKGGMSSAMKRAGVQWSIGRYLYDIPTLFGNCISKEEYKNLKSHEKSNYTYAKDKDSNLEFYWNPPQLHNSLLPKKSVSASNVKAIIELINDTNSSIDLLLENYGISELRELYTDEAGECMTLLIQRKNRIEENKKAEEFNNVSD